MTRDDRGTGAWSVPELVDHGAVVADDLRRQEMALFVGDIGQQCGPEPLEAQRKLQIALLLWPAAKRFQFGALPGRRSTAMIHGPNECCRRAVWQEASSTRAALSRGTPWSLSPDGHP